MQHDGVQSRCPYCNSDLIPGATYCQHCGRSLRQEQQHHYPAYQQYSTYAPYTPPDSYLVWAILATIFCCMPFGIVAIVYAAQVNSHLASGNYTAAQHSSDAARKWCLASLAAGLAVPLLYVLFFGVASLSGLLMY